MMVEAYSREQYRQHLFDQSQTLRWGVYLFTVLFIFYLLGYITMARLQVRITNTKRLRWCSTGHRVTHRSWWGPHQLAPGCHHCFKAGELFSTLLLSPITNLGAPRVKFVWNLLTSLWTASLEARVAVHHSSNYAFVITAGCSWLHKELIVELIGIFVNDWHFVYNLYVRVIFTSYVDYDDLSDELWYLKFTVVVKPLLLLHCFSAVYDKLLLLYLWNLSRIFSQV